MNGLLSKEDLVNPYTSVKNNKTPHLTFLLSFIHDFQGTVDCFGSLKTQERMKGKNVHNFAKKESCTVYTKENDDSKCEFGKHH